MEWTSARDELLAHVRCSPQDLIGVKSRGLYAWWDEDGELAENIPAGLPHLVPTLPFYVGIAAKQDLGARTGSMHLKMTRRSALRRSLAALLADELKLRNEVMPDRNQKFKLTAAGEERLTIWMLKHLCVTWVVHPTAHDIESNVIGALLPPLNDQFAHGNAYWKPLR